MRWSKLIVFYQFIIRFICQTKQHDISIYKAYPISDVLYEIGDNDNGRSHIEFPSNPEDLAKSFSEDLTLENTYPVWKYIVQSLSKNH